MFRFLKSTEKDVFFIPGRPGTYKKNEYNGRRFTCENTQPAC
jgi:hypothetical protein